MTIFTVINPFTRGKLDQGVLAVEDIMGTAVLLTPANSKGQPISPFDS